MGNWRPCGSIWRGRRIRSPTFGSRWTAAPGGSPPGSVSAGHGAGEGPHTVRVIYKGAVEQQARWRAPLVGRIAFLGLEARREAVLEKDTRPVIEFVGDSITEGVLIDDGCRPYPDNDQMNRPSRTM